MSSVIVTAKKTEINGEIDLPLSKSISNRALMMSLISGGKVKYDKLSDADDTLLLARLIEQIKEGKDNHINAHNCGTAYRFLTAYLSATEGTWILDGDERMRERPISALKNALCELGAEISYLGKPGYPPLKIQGRQLSGGLVTMKSDISSQYTSALMMIAPMLKDDLMILNTGEVSSYPYIKLTIEMMRIAGITVDTDASISILQIKNPEYTDCTMPHEYDWSSAPFWYELLSLSKGGKLLLKGLEKPSFQGDSVISTYFNNLNIETEFGDEGALITKSYYSTGFVNFDLQNTPDLVPACALTAAARGFDGSFYGLKGLRYKETDRLEALATELGKAGIICTVESDRLDFKAQRMEITRPFETYNDHRLAMAFAPLAILGKPVTIMNPEVVSKSYPGFWDEIGKVMNLEFLG